MMSQKFVGRCQSQYIAKGTVENIYLWSSEWAFVIISKFNETKATQNDNLVY